MYILDNHLHLRTTGRNVEAVKEFEKQGGTHIILVRYPDNPEDGKFGNSYEETLGMAQKVANDTAIKVFIVIGPYPVELIHLEKRFGLELSVEEMKKAIDLAARYVEEGKAIAIGEVGRPHFPVEDDIWEASNEVMMYAMERARDVDCPVVLHTESATKKIFEELALMADKVGLKKERVIKHYSPPVIDQDKNFGLFPSIIASEKNLRNAIPQGDRFLMESDYLDDRKRPGAVLAPSSIPRNTRKLMEEGLISEEAANRIHKEHPERVYSIEIE
jgi:TatD-related deoxyribonuclease